MTEKLSRPWTVWTTQVIAGLMFVLIGLWIFMGLSRTLASIPDKMMLVGVIIGLGLLIVLACWCLIVVFGLALRSPVGLRLGVGGLLLLGVLAALGSVVTIFSVFSERGIDYYQLPSFVLFTGSTLFFFFLAYRIAFGGREKAFFARTVPVTTEPPPPPSFENESLG